MSISFVQSVSQTERRKPPQDGAGRMRHMRLQFWARAEELARDECGFVSFINLIVILGILLGITLVANIGLVTRDKLETQNAADAITQAAGIHMARGMNAITAANHVIGEMHALHVLHHAWGGDNLERGGGDTTPRNLSAGLRNAWQVAYGISPGGYKPDRRHYADLGSDILSEAALGDAFRQLKRLTRNAYWSHATGAVLYYWPWTRSLGIAIMQAAKLFVRVLHNEWRMLKAAENVAKSALMRLKIQMRDRMIPALYQYTIAQQRLTPIRMRKAADRVGAAHQVAGSLFPDQSESSEEPALRLPTQKEPDEIARDRLWCSQLVRASVPWVQFWRTPVISRTRWTLPLSGFAEFYHKHTQEMSLSLADRARRQQGILMLVLDDHRILSGRKGEEIWTTRDGSRRAEELFAVVGFARRAAPPTIGAGIYVNRIRDGIATYAQSMIYNANPVGEPGTRSRQAQTGWDTLNWDHNEIPEWHAGQDFGDAVSFDRHPTIKLNWHTMLVPSTRISEAQQWQTGALGRILARTELTRPNSRTH